MQIHTDAKGKVDLDDITQRANRCTKWSRLSTISRFDLSSNRAIIIIIIIIMHHRIAVR